MPWLKVDDRVRTHPKVVMAGPDAAWFWFCGICYCREHLTDGFIPKMMLASLVPGVGPSAAKRHAATLVRVNLWHNAEGGYQVHDFLDWNPSRADIEADKEWDRRRKELYSDPQLIARVRRRDKDCCRYCSSPVNWKDRRGPTGGQFDHVIPRGDNSFDNIVVACRRCNIKKNNRTPEQAGMRLVPIQIENQSGTSSDSNANQFLTSDATRDHASARGLGSGLGLPSGSEETSDVQNSGLQRAAPLIMSPIAYAKALQHNAFVGSRLQIPHKLHDDFRRRLGGDAPEQRLQAWYAELDAEIERTGESISPNIWKWAEKRYAEWALQAEGDQAKARFLELVAQNEARGRTGTNGR
jgi:5-methylcytosine-specific restriction endonuclease McrA